MCITFNWVVFVSILKGEQHRFKIEQSNGVHQLEITLILLNYTTLPEEFDHVRKPQL